MNLSDVETTIDEGVQGWLTRHAGAEGQRADAEASGVLVLADHVVNAVTAACERWHLAVKVSDAQAAGWSVMVVSGRALPVLALTDVIRTLRTFNVR